MGDYYRKYRVKKSLILQAGFRLLSLPNVKILPKVNRRQRSKIMYIWGHIFVFTLENSQCYWKYLRFCHCLDSLHIQILLQACMYISHGVFSYSTGYAGTSYRACFPPKPRASFKKNKSQWAEHGGDPEIPLFPSPRCSRDRSGSTQNHLKGGLQFSLSSSKIFQTEEEFLKGQTHIPSVQTEEDAYNCKLQAYIYLCTWISRFF